MPVSLVAFDMDGTLTLEPSSWEHIHRRFGLWEGKADAYMARFLAGEIDYEEFSRLDALEWKGRPVEDLNRVLAEIEVNPDAEHVIRTIRARGIEIAIISSGLRLLADRVGTMLGIEHIYANDLVDDGKSMTGDIVINVSIDDETKTKGAVIKALADRIGVGPDETAAVGDSWGDIDMFRFAGTAILVNPKPGCLARARRETPHIISVPRLRDVLGPLGLS